MRRDRALQAPAAERNKDPILGVLARVLPASGRVLEIASGTGQHVVHFARALPRLSWQPSDPDAAMRESIRAHIESSGLGKSVADPIDLDTQAKHWGITGPDAIVCINMIHIAPWSAARGLMQGAGRLLGPNAPLVLYGPFRREGRHTAASNEAFDASLRQRDPEWGVRDLDAVSALANVAGLSLAEVNEMPANNLAVVYLRDG